MEQTNRNLKEVKGRKMIKRKKCILCGKHFWKKSRQPLICQPCYKHFNQQPKEESE